MRKCKILMICCLCLLLASLGAACAKNNQIGSLDELQRLEAVLNAEPVTNIHESLQGLCATYKIRYLSGDCEVVGYVSAPADYLEKQYPVLIYNRGGNQEFGKLSPELPTYYASRGYVVLASQYRGADGGTGMEQFGGEDVNDVLKLLDIGESFSFAKKGGAYMAGASRGGMMTYIACRRDKRIIAGAVLAGVSDTVANYNDRGYDMKVVYMRLIGGTPEEMPEEYEKRSAVRWADEIDAPLLIMHDGDADWRVLTKQSKDMAAALEKYAKEYKLIIYEDADHSLAGTGCDDEMDAWFNAHPF